MFYGTCIVCGHGVKGIRTRSSKRIVMHKVLWMFVLSLTVSVVAVLPLSAQQHRDRWNFNDYFSKNYFFDDKEDGDMTLSGKWSSI